MSRPPALLDGAHAVLTPEYVEFNFVLAGLYTRFLAWLLDALLKACAGLFLVMGLSLTIGLAVPGFASAASFVIWFLVDWGYSIAFETAWSGQTPGKKAMGIRVIQESGVRIGFYQSVLRNLSRAFDSFPALYLVGGVSALFSESQQRFGDMLAGTIVIRERRLKIPASIARPEGETTLLSDPVFLARVKKLSVGEKELLFSAAIRREELSMEARLKLFASISSRLQEDAGLFKPPHLSDEKLVLLVAAALAAEQKGSRSRGPLRPRKAA